MSFAGYLPANLDAADAVFAYPFPGLELDAGAWLIGGMQFTRLGWRTWQWLEHSDTARDEFIANQFIAAAPLFALLSLDRGTVLDVESDPTAMLRTLRPYADRLVGDAALALRLCRPEGAFVDPLFAVAYACAGGQMWREPQLYRQGVWSLAPRVALRIGANDAGEIESLFAQIRRYRTQAPNAAIDLALRHFRLSYTPRMDDERRLRFLIIALEAVLGPYREKRGGAPLHSRAALAIERGGGEATVLGTFLRAEGRRLRNFIAHGDPGEPPVPLDEGCAMLRRAVASVLLDALRFSLIFPSAQAPITALVGEEQAATTPLAYNALLGRAALGDTQARELLDYAPEFDFMND